MTTTALRALMLFACGLFALTGGCGNADAPPTKEASLSLDSVETTFVGPSADIYGTFQSHNHKVLQNEHGIFMTYATSADESYTEVTWRLARSTNGGDSFDTVYESTESTHPPVIETDKSGLIYLIHSDWWPGNDAYLKVFGPENDFAMPISDTTIPDGAAQKFVMHLDEAHDRIYYVANNLVPVNPAIQDSTMRFYALDLQGQVLHNYQLTTPGKSADAHYPLLALAENGDLYAAWTTVRRGQSGYWSIHFMRSRNGGGRWERGNGTPLSLPVIADEFGPTDRISLDDELAPSTWLSGFLVKRGKVHFVYEAFTDPPRQHYVRYDLATAGVDINTYPDWAGETLSLLSLDGACATNIDRPDGPIYCIGQRRDMPDHQAQLVVLSSTDNGVTWHDQDSGPVEDRNLYSIGAAREITPDGAMIGSYVETDWLDVPPESELQDEVWFYRVPVEVPGPARLPAAVTASVAHPTRLPAKAGDSDYASLFAASMTASSSNNNAWVLIDLGAEMQVSALKWKGAAGTPYPLHSPAAYTVEISSDGALWTEVASHAGGIGVVDGNEPINQAARYVRLVTTQINDGTGWALGLYEIWAEGTGAEGIVPTFRMPATVATSSSATGYSAVNAGDGAAASLWVASLGASPANNNARIQLDLGRVQHVHRLLWKGATGTPYPASSPADYTVRISTNGTTWTTVADRTNPAGVSDGNELIDQDARYIRLTTTKVNDGTGWSLGMHEIWAE